MMRHALIVSLTCLARRLSEQLHRRFTAVLEKATSEAVDYNLALWVPQNDDQVEFDSELLFARYVSVVPDYDEDDQCRCQPCSR